MDFVSEGHPYDNRTDQERGRVGIQTQEEDIPKQAGRDGSGRIAESNVGKFSQTATYKKGGPIRPNIAHDNGFLALGRTTPTTEDYLALAKWKGILEFAEAFRTDLTDGTAAYRHFLEAKGKPRVFSYERYVMNDESGRITLRNAVLDIQHAAIRIWKKSLNKSMPFQLTGSAINCTDSSIQFPYPATENWQKAIGGHVIWLCGVVTVAHATSSKPHFYMVFFLNAEDRYNFNPNAQDITTGIADSANGRFEQAGLAHQYNQTALLVRSIDWKGTELGVIKSTKVSKTSRHRQDQENRRARNRF